VRRKKTIRFRLTMGFIAVVLVANSILSLVAVFHLDRVWHDEVQTRVRLDLNSAWSIYHQRIQSLSRTLKVARLSLQPDPDGDFHIHAELGRFLAELRRTGGMDILCLLDAHGRVLHRVSRPEQSGDSLADNALVRKALELRQLVSGTVMVGREELEREGAALARRARLDFIETPNARPSEKRVNTAGMVQGVALPLSGPDGILRGLLYGAVLLNRSTELVDTIRDEVFRNQTFDEKDIGTATIFQKDLRISTNVRTADGERALGTRLSEAVFAQVLERGNIWADRAFVVNDWYITAYAPILDPDLRIIGALYVGLLEEPYVRPRTAGIWIFLGTVAATTLGMLVLLFFVTKLILRPLGRSLSMSRKFIDGDMDARVGIRPPGEMGLLCEAIDKMADAVVERQEKLEQATRQQIGQSEKLASIGRLAAGIAHEINNPLTGVLTFAHLLKDKENMEPQDIEDLDVIVNETTRVREIVRGLLDFARESPSRMQLLCVDEVLAQTMALLHSQKAFHKIVIDEEYADDLPQVCADRNQLQQVFLNLALNACEAMPDGGKLTIRSWAVADMVCIEFGDTGCGIRAEHIKSIFEPFFTTKPVGKGTGLGLSVSYGIIQQHRGELKVESVEQDGATFTVLLPICVDGVCQLNVDTPGATASVPPGERFHPGRDEG